MRICSAGLFGELASWYREFAERAGNLTIWEARLRTPKELEAKADPVERTQASPNPDQVGQADGKKS
jgi:hypothetical protein